MGVRVVSSPLRRAAETAAAIASAAADASLELDDHWVEADFGIAEGLRYDELEVVAPDVARRLIAGEVDIDWPEGEPAASMLARIAEAWRNVTSEPGPTIVVSHGGPIRVALALATGRTAADFTVPAPAAVVRLMRDRSGDPWRVVDDA